MLKKFAKPHCMILDGGEVVWGDLHDNGSFVESGRIWFRNGVIEIDISDGVYSGSITGDAVRHLVGQMESEFPILRPVITFAAPLPSTTASAAPASPPGDVLTCGACGGRWVSDHDSNGRCKP